LPRKKNCARTKSGYSAGKIVFNDVIIIDDTGFCLYRHRLWIREIVFHSLVADGERGKPKEDSSERRKTHRDDYFFLLRTRTRCIIYIILLYYHTQREYSLRIVVRIYSVYYIGIGIIYIIILYSRIRWYVHKTRIILYTRRRS